MLGSISSRFVRPRSFAHTRRMKPDSLKRLEIEPNKMLEPGSWNSFPEPALPQHVS